MTIALDRFGRGKAWCVLAILGALFSLAGATVVADAAPPVRPPSELDDSETQVDFPDAALRKAVEAALGKEPGDPITRGEMATVTLLRTEGVRQLDGIEHAVHLRVLSAYGAIADVSPLAGLTTLETLYLPGNEITDASPLAGLTSLTKLDLGNNGIADLSPLAGLTSLTRLDLDNNGFADLSPLADMTSLTWLWLARNEITDVSPLADMTSLTALYLYENEITDVSPLADMTSLTVLYLDRNEITDVSPLADMTSLTVLYLGGNEITEVPFLTGLTSLTRINLSFNALTEISLSGLTSLTYLNLYGNWLSGFSLEDLNSLEWLDMGVVDDHIDRNIAARGRTAGRITDVSALAGMTSLAHVGLGGHHLTDLGPLAGLRSLTSLDLTDNRIVELEPLAGLTSLTSLNLSGNVIADLSPLSGLTSLTSLDLGNNLIADLSPVSGLTSLARLSLWGNGLSDLRPLTGMTSLRSLVLNQNWISDVAPLAGMRALNHLVLYRNQISDVSPLVRDDGLGQGDYVDLRRNPLDATSRGEHIPTLRRRGVDVSFSYPELPEITDTQLRSAVQLKLADRSFLGSLDVSGMGVLDLTGLEEAGVLINLFLDRNKITDITPLAGMQLISLSLAQNMVDDWTPLASMEHLAYLALDGNSLTEVPPLSSRGWLRYLYLTDNSISDIAPLANQNPIELQLDGNSVTSLAPLSGMRVLEYLHVNDNEVADLSPVNFHSLRELLVRNNAVQDLSPLLNGGELLMVDVRRNPLADDALAVLDALRERRVTVLAGETVPYFPAAGGNRQGFVRVVNRSDADGHVFIEAVDDAGVRAGPLRMDVGARQAAHFNSTDLEYGSAAKGLSGGVGAPTAGDWRLEVISALDVEVLSYIRTEDGFVTAMHDVAADAMAPFFNPGSNRNQRSILRVVNTEAEPAKWTTGGYADDGKWHPMAGSLLVRPQHALTLTAQALEDEHGVGDGRGKWRLRLRGFPWFAMSLLESPTGHLTNLSTTPANATPLEDGATLHRLPLFPAAGGARQGFARVINRSFTSSGEVVIEAVDDAGTRSGPVRLMLRPRQAVHFNSADLENGNAAKGLDGAVGVGEGDWRLEFTSELDLTVLAYARTEDGFLTSLHDVAPREEDGALWIPFFNPGSNRNQASHLRLMNWGDAPAEVRITGIDDAGRSPGDAVRVTIPAQAARQFTAAQLETGNVEGLSGALGDGQGKWRLRVATSEEVDAMSLLSLPTGHMTDLSTTPRHPPRD